MIGYKKAAHNKVLGKKSFVSTIIFCLIISSVNSQEVPFDQLNLTGSALYAATKLKENFPSVIFTGGTRTLDSQARAIAQNIYRSQNSNWVGATYRDSIFIRKLNQEIMNNWNSIKGNESLILQTVNKIFANDNAGARSMSKHLSGYAFDIRVNSVNYNDLNSFVRTLPGFNQFLTQEGGLTVWHIEFNEAPIPERNNQSQIINLDGTWVGDDKYIIVFSGANYTIYNNGNYIIGDSNPKGITNWEKGTFSLNPEKTKFTRNCTHLWKNNTWVENRGTGIWGIKILSNNKFLFIYEIDENFFRESTYIKQ